jgi:hypothetical protein
MAYKIPKANIKPENKEINKNVFLNIIKARYHSPLSSDSWLQNQYPAIPSERLDSKNYLAYQNLEPFKEDINIEGVKRMQKEKPEIPFVILAEINKNGKYKKPVFLAESDARYYPQYELFTSAYHLSGFVELFHNHKHP